MSLLQWDEGYSVHVSSIDQQHQTLFRWINELHDAMRAGRGKDLVGKILSLLINYTESHFSAEEALLQLHGYPDLAAHCAAHKKLLDEVARLREKFEAGNTGLAVELAQFLQKWLKNHIQDTDKKYSPFLNAKGIH